MASGFTYNVRNGTVTDFKEFARDFAEIKGTTYKPDEVTSYYSKQIAQVEEEIEEWKSLSLEDWKRKEKERIEKSLEFNKNQLEENAEEMERYRAMIEKAQAWVPPTPDHADFKQRMISHLDESMNHDNIQDVYGKWIEEVKETLAKFDDLEYVQEL